MVFATTPPFTLHTFSLFDCSQHDEILKEKRIRELKNLFLQFYKSIADLKNFAILNYTCVSEITCVYDRYSGKETNHIYAQQMLERDIFSHTRLDGLAVKVEEVYAVVLAGGNHSLGKNQLHFPEIPKTFHEVTFRNGLYVGLVVPAAVGMIYTASTDPARQSEPGFQEVTRVYAGFVIFCCYLWLLGLNFAIYKHYKINAVYIFEFNPATYLELPHYFELIGVFSILVTYSYLLYLWKFAVPGFDINYHPLVLLGVFFVVLFFPLDFFYRSTRYWLVLSVLRLISAPFTKVTFHDFFIGDQLCSLVYVLLCVQYTLCIYIPSGNSVFLCNQHTGGLAIFIAMLPSWFRLLQCLRRFRDLGDRLHLVNAGKYTCSILVSLFAGLLRIYGGTALLVVYIIMAFIGATYAWAWDTTRDWGLFDRTQQENFMLRADLIYQRRWVYYLAIPINLALRCAWIITISENPGDPTIRDFFLALAEVLRRWQWNLFRVEFEHTSNLDKFRASHLIPLAFYRPIPTDHYRTMFCH